MDSATALSLPQGRQSYAGGPPAGSANARQRQMFDDSLRAALTLDEVRDLVRSLGFDSRGVNQTSDRHWTWKAQLP